MGAAVEKRVGRRHGMAGTPLCEDDLGMANGALAQSGPRDGFVPRADPGGLVAALGTERFVDRFIMFLCDVSAVEFVHLFTLSGRRPNVLRAISVDGSGAADYQTGKYMAQNLFGVDPWLKEWGGVSPHSSAVFHVPRALVGHANLQVYYDDVDLADRIMICGYGAVGVVGISLARSNGRGCFEIGDSQFDAIQNFALPLLAKHCEFRTNRAEILKEMIDIERIEYNIASIKKLPSREVQVAARIIRGFSNEAIALDLEIGKETALSYRKRLYGKLGISSYHELITWYMNSLEAHSSQTII
jgi:DNA-binding CsgD family transcriptional regulator